MRWDVTHVSGVIYEELGQVRAEARRVLDAVPVHALVSTYPAMSLSKCSVAITAPHRGLRI